MKAIHIALGVITINLICIFTVISYNVAEGADPLQAQALELITKTADKICVNIETQGNNSLLEYSGVANAELAKAIKKLVDIGVKGAAKYQKSHYQGPLREDLITAIELSQDCKRAVFERLEEKLIVHRSGVEADELQQRNKKAVQDPYNYEWKCGVKIQNEKRSQVAEGELIFGKMIDEPKMEFAKIKFSSKRTRKLKREIVFDSGAWTLGYFGECSEGECMGFISNSEPYSPVFMVNRVGYDEDAGRINISGVVMIKEYGKHSRYGFLSGICQPK